MKKIIITGITGQDGVHLTKLLLDKSTNYFIYGVSRNIDEVLFFNNLQSIKSKHPNSSNLQLVEIKNFYEVKKLIKDISPDQIYHLSGPSSVYESIKFPENKNIITKNFDYLLSAVSSGNRECKIFHASSSEMFAPSDLPLDENSTMKGNSPYAIGKLANHKKIKKLASNREINTFSGIMFNHESEFRSNEFLIMKIISEAINIKNNKSSNLVLGSLDYIRDWSYAGDIVEAMYLIVNHGKSYDYVLGSGVGTSIKEIVNYIFEYFNLDWQNYLIIDKELLRDNDPIKVVSNPAKIKSELNWQNKIDIYNLLDKCIESRLNQKV